MRRSKRSSQRLTFDESKSLAFFTKNGIVKRTNLSEFKNIRSVGVRAISLDENDELVTALIAQTYDDMPVTDPENELSV